MTIQTWLIVGASRGIGLEFAKQLLALGHCVIATYRAAPVGSPPTDTNRKERRKDRLESLLKSQNGHNLVLLQCDISDHKSIDSFTAELGRLLTSERRFECGKIDVCVLNAGILEFPGRISEITFESFTRHLQTNAIGPLIAAQQIQSLSRSTVHSTSLRQLSVDTFVFTSSDSGSAGNFRYFEDGLGAYSASKAALNQGLRHWAAEIYRKYEVSGGVLPVILALHPGEVSTDMGAPEMEETITPQESVSAMLQVIKSKGKGGIDETRKLSGELAGDQREPGSATFWTWDGKQHPW